MNQQIWMRYGCYEEDSNKLEVLFGQNVGGKANNRSFSLALLLWWAAEYLVTSVPLDIGAIELAVLPFHSILQTRLFQIFAIKKAKAGST